jgi:transcriptional regulator with XRE-family HTH domain
MSQNPEPPHSVGQQLRARREALDLTQPALAQRIGIDPSTVSATERDKTEIQRGKRPAWEKALALKPGTITRAYNDAAPIEPAPDQPAYADLNDSHERAIWEMNISESDRRTLIDILRADRKRQRRSA